MRGGREREEEGKGEDMRRTNTRRPERQEGERDKKG
jgi:hypothetical protein